MIQLQSNNRITSRILNVSGIGVLLNKENKSQDKTLGGIIIPDTNKQQLIQGKVVDIGPGFIIPDKRSDVEQIIQEDNSLIMKYIAIDVNIGDIVFFEKESESIVRIDGIEYSLIPYTAIKLFIREKICL